MGGSKVKMGNFYIDLNWVVVLGLLADRYDPSAVVGLESINR